MILGLQTVGLVFALIMIYFAYLHYRRGDINGMEILIWLICWFGAILIILFPGLFKVFASTVAISRPFDLAVVGGFLLIIPMVYVSYVRSKRMEKKVEEFIRQESLQKSKEKT